MQAQIDQGLEWCPACDREGWHTFCGHCGKRYHGGDRIWEDCPNEKCGAKVTTTFCGLCGAEVVSEFLERMRRGEVDWLEEARVASAIAGKIYRARPELHGRGAMSLVDAINSGFGKS